MQLVLPKYHRHVDFAMRRVNKLDIVQTNITETYPTEPHPYLGCFEHREAASDGNTTNDGGIHDTGDQLIE